MRKKHFKYKCEHVIVEEGAEVEVEAGVVTETDRQGTIKGEKRKDAIAVDLHRGQPSLDPVLDRDRQTEGDTGDGEDIVVALDTQVMNTGDLLVIR